MQTGAQAFALAPVSFSLLNMSRFAVGIKLAVLIDLHERVELDT